jgi:hypothetical protein
VRSEASGRPKEAIKQNLEWRMDRGCSIVWSRRQTSGASGGNSSGVWGWVALPRGHVNPVWIRQTAEYGGSKRRLDVRADTITVGMIPCRLP